MVIASIKKKKKEKILYPWIPTIYFFQNSIVSSLKTGRQWWREASRCIPFCSCIEIPKNIPGFTRRTACIVILVDIIYCSTGYKTKSAKKKGPWGEVQREAGTGSQELSFAGGTEVTLSTSRIDLCQHKWHTVYSGGSLESQCSA